MTTMRIQDLSSFLLQAFLAALIVRRCVSFKPYMTPQLRHPTIPRVGALSASLATTAANGLDNYKNNAVETSKDPRLGVLLLNLGGPETGDDVEGMHGMAWHGMATSK